VDRGLWVDGAKPLLEVRDPVHAMVGQHRGKRREDLIVSRVHDQDR
jgi:hypothetical protein